MRFVPLPTSEVRRLQHGGLDFNGHRPEKATSDGTGVPCRHCLKTVPKGADYLIVAHRPFPAPQPYAEVGPLFLCAEPCDAWDGSDVPPILLKADDFLIRGYGDDDRIIYGTGSVVPRETLAAEAEVRFARADVRYIHVRSARNNCYQCRIDR